PDRNARGKRANVGVSLVCPASHRHEPITTAKDCPFAPRCNARHPSLIGRRLKRRADHQSNDEKLQYAKHGRLAVNSQDTLCRASLRRPHYGAFQITLPPLSKRTRRGGSSPFAAAITRASLFLPYSPMPGDPSDDTPSITRRVLSGPDK